MRTEAGATSSKAPRRRPPVAWDWTDVVLFGLAAFLVAPLGVELFGHVAAPFEGGLSDTVRHAIDNFAEASGIYVSWVALVLILVMVRRRGRPGDLGWRRGNRGWLGLVLAVLLAPLVAAGTVLLAGWLAGLSAVLLPNTSSGQCNAVRHQFGHVLPVAILLVSFVDPAAEETIFRGFIYGWLRGRLPIAAAIVASAAIFGAAHFDLLLFLPLFGVGAVLAMVYELTGSLLVGAVVHGLFNAYNVVAILNAPSC